MNTNLSGIYFKEGGGDYKVERLVLGRAKVREHVARRHRVYTLFAILCLTLQTIKHNLLNIPEDYSQVASLSATSKLWSRARTVNNSRWCILQRQNICRKQFEWKTNIIKWRGDGEEEPRLMLNNIFISLYLTTTGGKKHKIIASLILLNLFTSSLTTIPSSRLVRDEEWMLDLGMIVLSVNVLRYPRHKRSWCWLCTWKSPPMVCVLPEPVCPYAKHVAMPPSNIVCTKGLAVYLKHTKFFLEIRIYLYNMCEFKPTRYKKHPSFLFCESIFDIVVKFS